MKKILSLIVLFPMAVIGQTQTENYIKSTAYKVATTQVSNPSDNQKAVTVTYLDGLGRPIQQIAHRQSGTGTDIITHMAYDPWGRQPIEFLPYANGTASLNYNSSAESELLAYPDYNSEPPFSEKLLEASPLNRVVKQGAPGTDWQVASGVDHTIKFDYQTNADEEVKKYTALSTWNSTIGLFDIALADDGHYPAYELYKTITKNENWVSSDYDNNTIQEFKDKQGRVVLKRTFGVSDWNGSQTNTAHDTYYIYDQYGNLTYVIPPLADTGSSIDKSVLDGLCYQYKYDFRNRLVEKKLPGKQWEYIVYNKLDKVVATGPVLSPFADTTSEGWLLTKYDAFGRSILTAWTEANGIASEKRYSLQNQYNTTTEPLFEKRNSTAATINNVSFKYTNKSLPTSGYHVLTVNYFDDYNYPGAPTTFSPVMHDNSQTVYYNNSDHKPKGLSTGAWIRILEDSTTSPVKANISHTLYDDTARPVRMRTDNYLTGYTQTDSKIDFEGKVNATETRHKRASADTELYVHEAFTYTDQSRPLVHTHQIGLTGTPQLLSKKEYDKLGQLIGKQVGGEDTSTFVGFQHVNYAYNIRGWLTAINDIEDLSQTAAPVDLFAFKLNYNTVANETNYTGTPLYNGNIAETYWRSVSDNIKRKYGYEYDDLNRLKNAIYQKPDSAVPVTNSYNESLTYDKNGNITSLQRSGDLDTDVFNIQIDELEYQYHNENKNQLLQVIDHQAHPMGFNDRTTHDYSYDSNGNLTSDENKEIAEIRYNHLNLPTAIIFTGSNKKIEYLYDATGQKVKKTVTDGSTITQTDYSDGFQYEKAGSGAVALKFFSHAEGYVNATLDLDGYSFNYVFNYTDHLGNIRMSYAYNSKSGIVPIEENHYYPFGLKHTKYNSTTWSFIKGGGAIGVDLVPTNDRLAYQYKYNGKEYQDELGLNFYDYGARNYDPAIGRWMNIDPMAELSRRFSPYTYAMNNPVFFIDPDGMIVDPSSQKEWDKQKKSITSERDRLQGKVDKLNATAASKGWSAEKLAGKIGDMSDRITGMNSSLGNLGTLEQSAQSYSLNVLSAGSTGDTSYDPASGNVVISFAGTANFVHESTHAGQYESGDIAFDSVSGKPYASDTGDEISAYKAQYAYDPSSVSGLTSSTSVKSSADITVNWLQNVSDSSGNKIYAPGGSANTGISPLNTNSNRADILKAFPNNPALQSLPSNFTFKSISTLKYRK